MKTQEQKVSYIAENITRVFDEDQINGLVAQITEGLVTEKLGIYVHKKFYGDILFDYSESVQWNVERFGEWLKKNFAGDRGRFNFYSNHFYTFYNGYSLLDVHEDGKIRASKDMANSLIAILRAIITGKHDADLGPANELRDQLKADGWDSKNLQITDVQAVSIKFFQNGRVDIKGLTDDQYALLIDLFVNKPNSFYLPEDDKYGKWSKT